MTAPLLDMIKKRFIYLTSFILVLSLFDSITAFSQEIDYTSPMRTVMHDYYPNSPLYMQRNVADGARDVQQGEHFKIISFNKKTNGIIVYNERHCGTIFITDQAIIKQVKKAKIPNLEDKKNAQAFNSILVPIQADIDTHYNAIASKILREEFVADSIAKREKFIADSIEQRQKFITDSIEAIRIAYADSINAAAKAKEELLKEQQMQDSINHLTQSNIDFFKEISPVLVNITGWDTNDDLWGQMSLDVSVINGSQKTIKYITIKGVVTNAVGDRCKDYFSGKFYWTAKGIGPIGPAPTNLQNYDTRIADAIGNYSFDELPYFFGHTASYIDVTSITIEYMDKSSVILSGKRLEKHIMYTSSDD